jgi:menaquinone-dependent protoporphyrinogen oxidase
LCSQRRSGEAGMKVLVTAASKFDSTNQIARAIGEVLRSRGFSATVARPEDVRRIDRYDAVVVGSAIYSGQWLRPARKFVTRSAAALAGRPVWVFSASTDTEAGAPVAGERLRARDHRVFARIANGDCGEARAWANEIADALSPAQAA